jgi:hypothetical protein
MITFDPDHYYLGIWFIGHDEQAPITQRYDWLMAVWRETPTAPWSLVCRTRRHHSENPWDTQDTKSWYRAEADPALTEAALLEKIEDLASLASSASGQPCHVVLVQGSGEQAFHLLRQQPWCHLQEQPSA